MKSIVYTAALLLTLASFSSCTKTYTCSCTFSTASKNFDVKIEKVKKNDAKVICNDYSLFVGNCVIK